MADYRFPGSSFHINWENSADGGSTDRDILRFVEIHGNDFLRTGVLEKQG